MESVCAHHEPLRLIMSGAIITHCFSYDLRRYVLILPLFFLKTAKSTKPTTPSQMLTTDDHNLELSSRAPSQDQPHQTLSSIIESFIADTSVDAQGHQHLGRELFNRALRTINQDERSEVLQEIIASLERVGDKFRPDAGVSQEFLDSLERVDVSSLPETADCPICTNRFADAEYPLVVKLPCHVKGRREHVFDMDCIAPWLKMHSSCPLCRFDMRDADSVRRERLARELARAKEEDDEEEEEDWDMYG